MMFHFLRSSQGFETSEEPNCSVSTKHRTQFFSGFLGRIGRKTTDHMETISCRPFRTKSAELSRNLKPTGVPPGAEVAARLNPTRQNWCHST